MIKRTFIAMAISLVSSSVLATQSHSESFCGLASFNDINAIEKKHGQVRFASFNASLNRFNAGQLIADLSAPGNTQAAAVAETIQRTRPDVILINEFDYDENAEAATLFLQNYLNVDQNGAAGINYPYMYVAPSNTGLPSGKDLNNDGSVGGPNDAFGFGFYPGQYGMVIYSKYPIKKRKVRTFQNFLWKDMPGALLPDDPTTPETQDWYTADELDIFRLSSKNHIDIPVKIHGRTVHVLASHPTPPVFDGAEDRNGTRNHDEIRFWADYVSYDNYYIYDDKGRMGGLKPKAAFVIMGDLNADPNDGDSTNNAASQLLNHSMIDSSVIPASLGGVDAAARSGAANLEHSGSPAFDTGDFNDAGPGNLRVDYVLPSKYGLEPVCGGVFWPRADEELHYLTGDFPFPSSDHRLIWMDMKLQRKYHK